MTKRSLIDELFLEWITNKLSNIKRSTYDKYNCIWDLYFKPLVAQMCLDDFSDKNFQVFISTTLQDMCVKRSTSTKKSIENVYNQFCDFLNLNFCISIPHIKFKDIQKPIHHNNILENTEIKTLSNYLLLNINTMNLGILICIFMGIRLGEVCALKWSDIDLDTHILHIQRTVIRQKNPYDKSPNKTCLVESLPKSLCSDRFIPIPNIIFSHIENLFKPTGYILRQDKCTDPRTLQKHFSSLLYMLHIKHHNFHALRHTFATNCIENNMDVKTLSELLGHSDVKITMNRYVHPTLKMKKNQLEIASSTLFDSISSN